MLNWNDVTTQVVAAIIAAAILGLIGLLWARRDKAGPWLKARPWAIAIAAALPTAIATSLLTVRLAGVAAADGQAAIAKHPASPSGESIPGNVVLASIVACDRLGADWHRFNEAEGRVIIGATDGPFPGATLSNAPQANLGPGALGGTKLTAQIVKRESIDPNNTQQFNYVTIGPDAATAPLPSPTTIQYFILPPYVSLYYCKKDA